MTLPFFSVVIPLYNKEKAIKSTIESVLAQSFVDFELLVIDDGSTDNSVSIVKQFADNRIRLLSKKNGGVSSARNFGIQSANTGYIAFLDADDKWDPNFLLTMYSLINKYPNCGMYCSAMTLSYPNGLNATFTRIVNHDCVLNDYFEASSIAYFMCASSCVIPKKIFDNCGNFTIGRMGEDLEMWARIMLKYDMAYTPKSLAYYIIGTTKQATAIKKLELNYPLFETFYFRLKKREIPIMKIAALKKYLHAKAKEEFFSMLFNRKFEYIPDLCRKCYFVEFAPEYIRVANNKILLFISYLHIFLQRTFRSIQRKFFLKLKNSFHIKKETNLILFKKTTSLR
ncbi:MAG: glycosyltransferase [Candidatus Merdousia sp.]|nr:glycosyltransferase [Candidatus Merdousia sp.]